MKTLVIHPDDRSTDFLRKIYKNINVTLINKVCSDKEIIDAIKNHDRIIMCGHGCPDGLFGGIKGLLIDNSVVPFLRNKECIFIWCNADKFVDRHNLTGFYSGMFISEVDEARYYNYNVSQKTVHFSNNFFSNMLGSILDKMSLMEIFKFIKENYTDSDNKIIDFNNNRLFYAEISEDNYRIKYDRITTVDYEEDEEDWGDDDIIWGEDEEDWGEDEYL